MQIFLVARCLLFFCSARHLSFTLTGKETDQVTCDANEYVYYKRGLGWITKYIKSLLNRNISKF